MTIDPNNLSGTAVLTFADEFNSLNLWNGTSGTWTTNYWWGAANGSTLSGNGEQEWYINHLYPQTASVTPWTVSNGGILTLTAAPASASIKPYINNYAYTSGMITSYESFTQQYGYFEMKAQLPAGQGLWPAFWLLPANGQWPPEIDVMEVLGNNMTTLYTYTHTNETGTHTARGEGNTVVDMSTGYHTYGVNWQADYITWYFDGVEVFKTNTPADLHQPMYILANLAVGGYWPGMVDSTTPFPAQMKIDYIHAYADLGTAPPPPPPSEPVPTVPTGTLFSLSVSASWTTTIRGSARNDTLTGTAGADRMDGRGGTDTMSGLGGDDTYIVERSSDVVIENVGSGIDTVQSRSSYTLPANVENLTLTGTGALTATGNALGNILKSNNSASTLSGGDGNDILIAGNGANILTGGAGSDIFQFSSAGAGRVTDFNPTTDMLDLRGLFSNYQGSNPVADGLISFSSDGAGGTQVFFDADGGGSGLKKLITTLQGVSSSSLVMQSNWYFSSTASTPTTDPPPSSTSGLFTLPTSGTGIDTVSTSASPYTMPSGIENVILTSSAAQTVTGNSLNNIMTSNNNNYGSTMNGSAGNDILIAGRGLDVLTGGAGSDIFQFSNLPNQPWVPTRVTDFTLGQDMMDFRGLFAFSNFTGTDPTSVGYLSFQDNGVGTSIYFDPDGWYGPASNFFVGLIDNVSHTSLQAGIGVSWFFQ